MFTFQDFALVEKPHILRLNVDFFVYHGLECAKFHRSRYRVFTPIEIIPLTDYESGLFRGFHVFLRHSGNIHNQRFSTQTYLCKNLTLLLRIEKLAQEAQSYSAWINTFLLEKHPFKIPDGGVLINFVRLLIACRSVLNYDAEISWRSLDYWAWSIRSFIYSAFSEASNA